MESDQDAPESPCYCDDYGPCHWCAEEHIRQKLDRLREKMKEAMTWAPASDFDLSANAWTSAEIAVHHYRAAWNEVRDILAAELKPKK